MWKTIIGLFVLFPVCLSGQNENLQQISKEEPLFQEGNKLTAVKIIAENEKQLTVRLSYEGFQGKSFVVTGEVLDRGRRKMSSIPAVEKQLIDGSQQAELSFTIDNQKGKGKSSLALTYLKLSIRKKEGLLGDLGIALDNYAYLYRLNRSREINGKLVNITPLPLSSAVQLKVPTTRFSLQDVNDRQTSTRIAVDTSKQKPQGPKAEVEFLQQLKIDPQLQLVDLVPNLSCKIFADQNPESGFYYYLPTAYNLSWSIEKDYGLFIHFLKANGQESPKVAVTAKLRPNLSRSDLQLIEVLLRRELQGTLKGKFKKLVSLPLAGTPQVLLDQLANFGVDAQDMNLQLPVDLLDPMTISWTMENVEDLQASLVNQVGLSGNIKVKPEGDIAEKLLTINIKLDDPRTLGHLELEKQDWRKKRWANPTPFPIVLKRLHLLILEGTSQNARPAIYSWKLNDTKVSPRDSVRFFGRRVPTALDGLPNVAKVWLEYSVRACPNCDVWNILPSPQSQVHPIEFTIMNPLSFSGAEMMKIKLRTVQSAKGGSRKTQLPTLTVKSDGITLAGGQLLVPNSKEPEFEYFIQLLEEDGKVLSASRWVVSKETDVAIGSHQLKQLFPVLRKK